MREWDRMEWKQSKIPEWAIVSFLDKLEEEGILLHGFGMLEEGKLLAEGYWAPYQADTLHRMYSVGKSFVSLAIGLLQEEGKLALEDFVCQYFPDKCPKNGAHRWLEGMTIKQMLTMTTCHSKTTYKQYDGDWVESFFRVEPSNLPGAVFSYDTSSTHVLSALVERLSGRKLMEYLRERCFDKIGVSKEAYFLPDPYGVSQGGSGLNCTLRDMLAVAELVMNEGVYKGEQLIPAEYIRQAVSCQVSTRHQTAYDEQFGYGYQIWRGRHDSFYFYGIGGQLAVCLPGEKFILVTMGNTLENKNGIKNIFDAFYDKIFPWIKDGSHFSEPKEREVGNCPELDVRLSRLTLTAKLLKTERTHMEAFLQGKFSWIGQRYEFNDNKLGISALRVACDREEGKGVLYLEKDRRESKLLFGMDTYLRQKFPWPEDWTQWMREYCKETECCCQGILESENELFLRCYILGPEMANVTIVISFVAQGITVKMQKGIDNGLKRFEGVASGTCKCAQ